MDKPGLVKTELGKVVPYNSIDITNWETIALDDKSYSDLWNDDEIRKDCCQFIEDSFKK